MFPISTVPPLDEEPPDDEDGLPDGELLEDELPQAATTVTTKTPRSALKVALITLSLPGDYVAAA
jgi:hypothetical protein